MRWEPVRDTPRLHETPLATIRVDMPRISVEADDEHEERIRLVFETYQAMRVITSDCFEIPDGLSFSPPWQIYECIDSVWVRELKETLRRGNSTADFMDKARHFLIPLQDDFVEVVAWDLRHEPVRKD